MIRSLFLFASIILMSCEKPLTFSSSDHFAEQSLPSRKQSIILGSDWSRFQRTQQWYENGYDLFATDTSAISISFQPGVGVEFAVECAVNDGGSMIAEFINGQGAVVHSIEYYPHNSHQSVYDPFTIYIAGISCVRLRFTQNNGGYITYINLSRIIQ